MPEVQESGSSADRTLDETMGGSSQMPPVSKALFIVSSSAQERRQW